MGASSKGPSSFDLQSTIVAAVMISSLSLTGTIVMPAGGSVEADGCGTDCGGAEDPIVLPMDHEGSLLELIKPFVDRDTYQLLDDAIGPLLVPPHTDLVDRPSRPTELSAEADAHIHAKVKAGKGRPVHIHAQVKVNESVSLVGSDRTTEQTVVPCTDPDGCPDLVVDPTTLAAGDVIDAQFGPDDCAVKEGSVQPGERRLLRFTFTTPNIGNGDLVIGRVADHPEWFLWAECHGHYHFAEYADYRLWTPLGYVEWVQHRQENPDSTPQELLQEHPRLRDGFVAGHKQGFCVIDVRRYDWTQDAAYSDCEDNQGISRGWGDEYGHTLDGQWIDITDLEPGPYVLEAEVNAERFYQEMDYSNNSGSMLVVIQP